MFILFRPRQLYRSVPLLWMLGGFCLIFATRDTLIGGPLSINGERLHGVLQNSLEFLEFLLSAEDSLGLLHTLQNSH